MSIQRLKLTRTWETRLSHDDNCDPNVLHWMGLDDVEESDLVGEFSGRACYQSWHKPNPDTRDNADYLAHIQDVHHYSVLSHAFVGYYIEGVSRSLTHELIRHRWLSFSQLSQRYVRTDEIDYVIPPLCRGDKELEAILEDAADNAKASYDAMLARVRVLHPYAKVKQWREAARAVLPGMTETKIVVTGNLRAWRDFLEQRLPEGADAEIRELAQALLVDLKQVAPGSFQDLTP